MFPLRERLQLKFLGFGWLDVLAVHCYVEMLLIRSLAGSLPKGLTIIRNMNV